MSGRCETCKWWEVHGKPDGTDFGVCGLTVVGNEPLFPESKALARTLGKAWVRYLETSPDFGCVQHEPKDATP